MVVEEATQVIFADPLDVIAIALGYTVIVTEGGGGSVLVGVGTKDVMVEEIAVEEGEAIVVVEAILVVEISSVGKGKNESHIKTII